MTDRDSQGIGGIGRRKIGQVQYSFDHILDLVFLRPAVSYNGLLDIERSIFIDWYAAPCARKDNYAPRFSLSDETFYIFSVENIFYNEGIGRRLINDLE